MSDTNPIFSPFPCFPGWGAGVSESLFLGGFCLEKFTFGMHRTFQRAFADLDFCREVGGVDKAWRKLNESAKQVSILKGIWSLGLEFTI